MLVDEITLLAHYRQRGPGKVFSNLKKGLELLGVKVHETVKDDVKHVGILQLNDMRFEKFKDKKCVAGPNLFSVPTEQPLLCQEFHDFLVPSLWVKDVYEEFPEMAGKNIGVWSVGIETEIWKKSNFDFRESAPEDCFIYYKNRDGYELNALRQQLANVGLSHSILMYGNYREEELAYRCANSKFAIILSNTESQGIAYMQILSAGVPCLVVNKTEWISPSGIKKPSTSVPYFDNRCGHIVEEIDEDTILRFSKIYKQFAPRDYMIENHTLVGSAKKYLSFFS